MSAISLSWAHIGAPSKNGRRRMVIFASKLAGCAGMHKYMNRDEMRYEFRHAVYGELAKDSVPDGYLPPKEYEDLAKSTGMTHEARELVQAAVQEISASQVHETSKIVVKAIQEINAMPGVSDAAKEIVKKELMTHHGVVGEEAIRKDTQESSEGREIRANNSFMTTREPIVRMPGFDVFVGGRHDGLMTDAEGHEILTEIKNRTRRHMGVPLYERIQLHAYMDIFGVRRGMLVENYKRDRREHEVYFDDDLWNGVVESTDEFLKESLLLPGDSNSLDEI